MQFTSAIAIAILAFTASAAPWASPAPYPSGAAQPSGVAKPSNAAPHASSSTATPWVPTDNDPEPAPLPADTTQKLFISDTAADRFKLLPDNKNFRFDFSKSALIGQGGAGGDLIAANRKTFPALVGTGSGMAVGTLGGCGFNTPHVHPRATELQIVTEGTIITEMVPENGVFEADGKTRRVIRNELTKYQMQPFYQGSVHTQYNPTCEPAVFVASFNNEDFGTGQIADELFALDAEVTTAAFGEAFSADQFEDFKHKIPASIAQGIKECIARCPNLPKANANKKPT